jgi:acyl-CoA synthetase (NDP forming)
VGIPLDKLFAPQTVALVGASDERHYARSIIANLRAHGFADEAIFPVNPRYREVAGLTCYPDLTALPRVPDATGILIGKTAAHSVLHTAAELGSRAALVIADGYAEESTAGLDEQHALGDIARTSGLAMLGPNTLGYVVPATGAGMWCAGALPAPLRPGGVAVLSQSSGMLNLLMSLAGRRLLGVRACVSVGNAEVIGLPELISHFARDDDTDVLGLVVESIDRPRALLDALQLARAAGKPVVVLKIGVSDLGRQNSVAHTGRMAGPEQGWTALFDRLGVVQARDLDDLVETLTLFGGTTRALADRDRLGVAFATISGGETSLVCDIAADERLSLAGLDPQTLATLRDDLGKPSMIGNPLDLQNTRTSRPDVFWHALGALCADPNVDLLAVRFNLSEQPNPTLEELYRRVAGLARGAGKTLIVLTRAYEHLDLAWWRFFADLGLPFVLSYRNAMRGLAALASWLATRSRPVDPPRAAPLTAGVADTTPVELAPDGVAEWLTRATIPYVRSELAATPDEAVAAAERIGWPVALKAVAPGLVHKSEAGGVALDLNDTEDVEAAAKAMALSVAEAIGVAPEAVHFEVQQMARAGVEVILGAVPDPTWGPIVLIGAGGIHAETLSDTAWDLPPISPERAGQLLRRLRIWPVLDGTRNQQRADVEALVAAISAFSRAVVDDETVAAVDLNPIVVGPEGRGVRVVDASVLVSDQSRGARAI